MLFFKSGPELSLTRNCRVHCIIVTESGVQKIFAGSLKKAAAELTHVFLLFFPPSMDQGIIPGHWKTANVVPIYQLSDHSRAENYIPVFLTSISCKALEHIVTSSIMQHIDTHNIHTYHTMPCHAMPCHAMPCHAMPCHAMPCHAMPYHTIPYHTIPYHTIPYHTIPYRCLAWLSKTQIQWDPTHTDSPGPRSQYSLCWAD